MKTRISILWIFMTPIFLFSQNGSFKSKNEKKERIEAMKIAYITEKLDLSSDEAKVFWPVFNNYEKEQHELRQEKKNMEKKSKEKWKSEGRSLEKMTERDLDVYMERVVEFRDKENQLKRKYYIEFKKVLEPYKILLLYESKREFKKEILRMIKKNYQHNRGPRPVGK
jgi:hypothetical protein